MKQLIICLSFFAFNLSSKAQSSVSNQSLFSTNFVSLTVPQDYQGEISYLNATNTIEKKKVGQIIHDYTLLGSFPNLVSSVTMYQVDENGSLSLLGNSLTVKNSTYLVIYDYAQTQTIHLKDSAEKLNYFALVGVSVRMVARINSKSAGINLTDIFSLGAAASRSKVSGSLEVRVNGVNSQQINSVIPVTTDLSPSSISNALQAVATIKSHLYDSSTKITPQFLAFNAIGNQTNDPSQPKPDFKILVDKVKSFQFD